MVKDPARAVQWWRYYTRSPLYPLTAVLIGLVFWQFVIARATIPGIPTKYLGSPYGIWVAFTDLLRHGYEGTPFSQEVVASLVRVLLGFSIGAGVAVPVGLLMGHYRALGSLFEPILSFLRPIPALAFIPVAIIWFGIGETGKVAVIATTAFLYAVLGSSAGVRSVPSAYLKIANNYHLSGTRMLFWVILPAAMPQIIIGLRTALALSWAVVVAAELIAAQQGLGYMISDASTFFRINVVYVGIIFIGLIGIAMDLAFSLLQRRLLHWMGR